MRQTSQGRRGRIEALRQARLRYAGGALLALMVAGCGSDGDTPTGSVSPGSAGQNGASGKSGSSGSGGAGTAGISGAAGSSGAAGGQAGGSGSSGISGQAGSSGASGAAGQAGGAGASGTSGQAGSSGAAGGAGGQSGAAGASGEAGASGGSGGTAAGSGGASGQAAGGASGEGGQGGGASGQGGAGGSTDPCAGPPGPIKRVCRPATNNECDGKIDQDPQFKPEGTTGNGFDDDCDGLVDEGCDCPGAGSTKDCLLLPSSQTSGSPKYEPAGWCASNSKGKVTCELQGKEELKYNGQCIGAQPPLEENCGSGDFNCDGLDGNAANVCACSPVECPDPLYTTPFPDPSNIGQFSTVPDGAKTVSGIDGLSWIKDPGVASKVTDWRWTLVGGPCDDILPNPTFAVFPSNQGTPVVPWVSHLGLKTLNLPQVPDEGQPDPAFSTKAGSLIHRGWVLKGGATPGKIFPAFSLSGDYYITGKFKYPNPANPAELTEGQCTQVVKVRAPGLRVELCWPEVGPEQGDHDVDLHLARLQGNPSGDGKHGWFTTAGNAPKADDCYYSPNSACGNRFNASGLSTQTPSWYADEVTDEPGGVGVCHGWGSRRFDGSTPNTVSRPCTSPRLDRDNITCNPAIEDPNSPETDGPDPSIGYTGQQGKNSNNFCGPENINLDAKVLQQGERFAIGVQCYDCVQGKNGQGGKPAHPRVNVYCNGELKLGFGYDPAQPEVEQYPALITEGQTYHGSFWNVATVAWNNDPSDPCTVEGSGAVQAGPDWDDNSWRTKSNGSAFLCVQNGPLDSGGDNEAPSSPSTINWLFTPAGDYPDPVDPNGFCPY